ncbi:MAG: PspC domain-containing protein [Flavobacteriales bacterium]|nr:PspC domain-containing protein [Flavobacteriales bacterium]
MNKTISIHLQGIPFLIEEEAYAKLRNYLDQLSNVLGNQDGADEIIQDIEMRMAELFSKSLDPNKKVLELKTVEEVLIKLGDPDVFLSDEQKQSGGSSSATENQKTEKRLFRDEENSILGGVCAGLSCYFGLDVVIVRAIFVLIAIFGGFGLPLYFILWMITPKARTSIEKLQMKGEPVNFESMKAEMEKAAENIQEKSKKWANNLKGNKTLENNAKRIIRFIRKVIGIFILFFGTALFINFMIFLFIDRNFIPSQYNGEDIPFDHLLKLIAETSSDAQMLFVGIVLTALATIGLLWLLGIRFLISFRSIYFKYSVASLIVLFMSGVILLIIPGVRIGNAFAVEGEVEKQIAQSYDKELILEFKTTSSSEKNGFKTVSNGETGILKEDKGKIYANGMEVSYEKSSDTLFHVYQINSARGTDHQAALKKARNIKLGFQQNKNVLVLDAFHTFPKNDKLRDQEVKLLIQVPVGGYVKVNNRVVYPYLKVPHKKLDEKSQGYVDGDGSYQSW